MNKHARLWRSAFLLSTTLSTTLALGAGLPSAALAQTAAKPVPQPVQETAVDEIVVTGSRIVREGYDAPTPLAVISTEQLESSADTNIANYLVNQPVFSGSQTARTNTYGATARNGVNALSLRSLGGRTLILLDGRRVEPATSANEADVSSLPQQLIARVDVVTGGASAVYGSDAVAGVVNFILDKDFTGVKGEIAGGDDKLR